MRIFSLIAAVVLVACGQSNPVTIATQATPENRPETIAFALTSSYVVLQDRAVALVESPDTPASVKQVIRNLNRAASPVVGELQTAAVQYKQVRAALAAGTTTEEKLSAALVELNRLLTEAAPHVNALASALGGRP